MGHAATFLTADGASIYYETRGVGSPLLLISGMGADHRAWDELLPELEKSYTCIAYDHRGVGNSTPRQADFSIRDLAADACELLDACGAEQANVIGISMGGAVAQELAINHPDKVLGLVLVSTWARADAYRRVFGECRMRAAGTLDRNAFWKEHLLWCYSREFYRENPQKVEAICRALADTRQDTQDLIRQHRANLQHDTVDRLRWISAPTLIVAGKQDISTPPELAEVLHAGIAGSRLAVLDRCGHSLTSEAPARFSAAALAFLHSLAAGRQGHRGPNCEVPARSV